MSKRKKLTFLKGQLILTAPYLADQWLLGPGRVYQCSALFFQQRSHSIGGLEFVFISNRVSLKCAWPLSGLLACWLAGWLAESRNPTLAMMSFAMSIGCKVLKRGLLTLVTSRSLSLLKLGVGGGQNVIRLSSNLFSRPRLSDTFLTLLQQLACHTVPVIIVSLGQSNVPPQHLFFVF